MKEQESEKRIRRNYWLEKFTNALGGSFEKLVTGGQNVSQRHEDFLQSRFGYQRKLRK